MVHTDGASSGALAAEEKPYVPHDTLNETAKTALLGLGGGVFVSAVQNALQPKNYGSMAVFTRGAPIIGLCAAGPGVYAFVSRTIMNLREKEDGWAAAVGGFAGGAVFGLPFRRFPAVMGFGAAFAAVQGAYFFMGGRLDSFKKEDDEFARKETIRRTTRVPVAQTVSEIGEGRGIRPPGYEERRRERILEKYGLEINPVKATVESSS